MIKKIVSGGQTGADQGGLQAAEALGIHTGGYAPKGFKTEVGPASWLGTRFNLVETESTGYPMRTLKNVATSDVTIIFATQFGSPGTKETIKYCGQNGKEFVLINPSYDDAYKNVVSFLARTNPEIVNIAGNRESKSVGIQANTTRTLQEAIRIYHESLAELHPAAQKGNSQQQKEIIMKTPIELAQMTLGQLKQHAADMGIKGISAIKLADRNIIEEKILALQAPTVEEVKVETPSEVAIVPTTKVDKPPIKHKEKDMKEEIAKVFFHPIMGEIPRIDLHQRDQTDTPPEGETKSLMLTKMCVIGPVRNEQGMVIGIKGATGYRVLDSSTPYYELVSSGTHRGVTIEGYNDAVEKWFMLDLAMDMAYKGVDREASKKAGYDVPYENPNKFPKRYLVGNIKKDTPLLLSLTIKEIEELIGEEYTKLDNPHKALGALLMTPADFSPVSSSKNTLNVLVLDSMTIKGSKNPFAAFDGTILAKIMMRYKQAEALRNELEGKGTARWNHIVGSAQARTWGKGLDGATIPALKGRTINDFEFFLWFWKEYVAPQFPHLKYEDIDLITTKDNVKTRKSSLKNGDIIKIPVGALRIVRCKMGAWGTSGGRQWYRVDHAIAAAARAKYGADNNAATFRDAGNGNLQATMNIYSESDTKKYDDILGTLQRCGWSNAESKSADYSSLYSTKRAMEHSYFLNRVVKCRIYDDADYIQGDPRLDKMVIDNLMKGNPLTWYVTLPKGKEWDEKLKEGYKVSMIRYPIVTECNAQGVEVVGRNNTKDTTFVPCGMMYQWHGDDDGDTGGYMVDKELQFPATIRPFLPKAAGKDFAYSDETFLQLCKYVGYKIIDASDKTGLMDNALTRCIIATMRHAGNAFQYPMVAKLVKVLGPKIQEVIESFKHMESRSGEDASSMSPSEFVGQYAPGGKLIPVHQEHGELRLFSKNVGGRLVYNQQTGRSEIDEIIPGTAKAAIEVSRVLAKIDAPLYGSPFAQTVINLKGYNPVMNHFDSEFRRIQCDEMWRKMLGVDSGLDQSKFKAWLAKPREHRTTKELLACMLSGKANDAVNANRLGRLKINSGEKLLYNRKYDHDSKSFTDTPMYRWTAETIIRIGAELSDGYNAVSSSYRNAFSNDEDRRRAYIHLARLYRNYIETEWHIGDLTNFSVSRIELQKLALDMITSGQTDMGEIKTLLKNKFKVAVVDTEEPIRAWEIARRKKLVVIDTCFIHHFTTPREMPDPENKGEKITVNVPGVSIIIKSTDDLYTFTGTIPNEPLKFMRHLCAFIGAHGFGLYGNIKNPTGSKSGNMFFSFHKFYCVQYIIKETSRIFDLPYDHFEKVEEYLKTLHDDMKEEHILNKPSTTDYSAASDDADIVEY